ncbi:MAG TPA: hypothetical protein PLT89_09755 [Syntrophomonadaceae bacterium]|nr:hypothetical protein [Syntrophomonadaceae bacterium]
MPTATASTRERTAIEFVTEGINLLGGLSSNLASKINRLDPQSKEILFKDFPLEGSPEETFKNLAKWAKTIKQT